MSDDRPDDGWTLGDTRDWLRAEVVSTTGAICPCCTQRAKVYSRKVNATMARTLIRLYRAGAADAPVHAASLPGDNHEVSQLEWWGLVRDPGVGRPDGGRAGLWQLTLRGVQFALGRVTIPRIARVYDARVLGYRGPQVNIEDCLGDRFSYAELMSA